MLFTKFWGVPNTKILWKTIYQHGALKHTKTYSVAEMDPFPSKQQSSGRKLGSKHAWRWPGWMPGVREG